VVKIPDKKFFNSITKRDIFRYNIFTSGGTKVSSCCRLLSDAEMLSLASQSNSFGGSSVSLGSHRVVTVNFHRIALEAESMDDYYTILQDRVDDAAKILKAHKTLIINLKNSGLQQFISNGWINMSRLFSTFGVLGIYEAQKTLQERFKTGDRDITEDILIKFNSLVNQMSEKYEIIGNIEQIPGESFAVRLANADKLIFDKKQPYRMYANQFVPLWEDASIWEKFDADGKYNKLLTGGGIVHAQIGEPVTSVQARKIIMYAIESGCEHFALNGVYTEFEDGTVLFGKYNSNPQTNSPTKEWYTRIVGFFTPVSSWNQTRREWEFDQRTFVDLPDNLIE
jgi:ribonucleoside-triphosphate reductase